MRCSRAVQLPTALLGPVGFLGRLIVTSHRVWLTLLLASSLTFGVTAKVLAMPAPVALCAPSAADGAFDLIELAQAQPAQAPSTPPAAAAGMPASDAGAQAPAAADEPIGNVVTLSGIVTVIRNKNSLPLHLRDDIYLNDTVQTSSSSSLGITFNDATTFNLSANAKITIDNYIYEDGGKNNSGIFDIGKGTVAFVAAAVAKTGDMKITTPTSTLGIRGTTGLVEVLEGGAAAGANNVNIKLYPDADGHVGRIEVSDRSGIRLGALTQGASGFTIRPGVGGARPTAVPLRISPQQIARDQGFVRKVHSAQDVGRRIVTEQRALRRANPLHPNVPNRGNQPRGPQRQNQAPEQNRPGQPQQGAPKRQGQQQPHTPQQPNRAPRPGEKKSRTKQGPQPATPQRQGATPTPPSGGQPSIPSQPGIRQGGPPPTAPGVRGPARPNRPALLRPRLPAPKGKQQRKRRL